MKRILVAVSLFSMVLGFTAFECSSPDITGAKLYISQKNYEKAKEALLREISKNPKSDEGYYLLGYVYGEEGDFTKMLNAFDSSLAISKKHEKDIQDQKRYYWAISFNRGVGYFNKATKTTAQDSVKLNYNKAAEAFNNAIMLEPDSSAAYKNLAYVYLNLGDYDSAISPLEKLIKLEKSADGYSLLGEIYNEKGSNLMNTFRTSKNAEDSIKAVEYYNKAITVLEEGRKFFPENADILRDVSNAYVGANRLEDAMKSFKAGVEKEPENKFYRYNYGVLLLNAKDFAGAEKQFKKAVEIDSNYTNAIYNLAVTYARWGADIREQAEAKDQQDESYKEKFKQALPWMEKYLKINPKEPAVWELLGKIYANLGMTEKSKEAFDNADKYR
ncbi:tetratricopeptide repeat protein [Melioribacteraceae bacterium 4301-Me]|uniref:tetratricopeptide repeat protein n=1 Tax=Pyranulibacter aquaticus TaxID=3163344 RepID=UPI003595CBE9